MSTVITKAYILMPSPGLRLGSTYDVNSVSSLKSGNRHATSEGTSPASIKCLIFLVLLGEPQVKYTTDLIV